VTVPRPEAHSVEAAGEGGRRLAAAAVADALTTAFMMMSPAEIEHLCAHSPGVEAWILEASQEPETDPRLVHFGGRVQQG
jgi:hypothetical protein